jgi:dethiobiotin synthetase
MCSLFAQGGRNFDCRRRRRVYGSGNAPEITDRCFQDAWAVPVILCAQTGLGTINHTLLSVEALRQREMTLHGLIFIGEDNPDTMRTIADFSGALVLGHVPHLDVIDSAALLGVFAQRFRKEDFT